MKADIIRQLNQQNTLDNMIPLTEFSSVAKLRELERRGYYAGYTAESWKAEFPEIDPKYILCPQTVVFPASLRYYDPEHYICFDTYIYNGKNLYSGEKGSPQDMLLDLISRSMKDYEEKNYIALLLPISSEESGGIAIRVLREMLEREEPNPKLYDAFLSVYTLCNTGAHILGRKALERLQMCKSIEQKSETAQKLSKYPGDSITVYRGEGSKSTPQEKACSWTTDINKAYFFASWRSAEDSTILTGRVPKDKILEFIDRRNEKEVLVQPGAVELIHRKRCVGWDAFQNIIAADMLDSRHRFPKESLARNIIKELEVVYSDAGAADHDKEHSLRVALLANFMFRMDVLLRKENFKKECGLLTDLSRAAVYHDAGRTDNTSNTEHGAAGYEKYRKDHGENKMVKFLTTYHCRHDKDAREYWEDNFTGDMSDSIWKAFCILKDADALDRVRFGNLSRDFLDVNTLRTETAKSLVPCAFQLAKAKLW